MYLHLLGNDPKFPGNIRAKYEAVEPGNHQWVILKSSSSQQDLAGPDFEYIANPKELIRVVEQRSDWSGVIINGMLARVAPYLNVLPRRCGIGYQIWGVEAYNAIISRPDELYEYETAKISVSRLDRLKFWLSKRGGPLRKRQAEARKVAGIVDVASFAVEEEPKYFVNKGLFRPGVKTLAVRGHLTSQQVVGSDVRGGDILLGNSGDPTNNHIDLLLRLRKASNLGQNKIIAPLSYGGKLTYRKAVIATGEALFGDRFVALTDFLPLEEYNEAVGQCHLVLMNHKRQQAAGNVIAALARGATVYMRSESSLSRGLKRQGFAIRDLEGFEKAGCLRELEESYRRRNKELYEEDFGEESAILSVKAFLNCVSGFTS